MPSFILTAGANTDIWKKPGHEAFNAPYKTLEKTTLSRFSSASLTFTSTYTLRYDQSGLLLLLTHPSKTQKWVKTGVELEFGTLYLSAVGCDNWADWSITTPPGGEAAAQDIQRGRQRVTILAQRQGKGLWIYYVDSHGEKHAMREIAWFFADEDDDQWQMQIAAMLARPSKEGEGQLETHFEDFQVELQ